MKFAKNRQKNRTKTLISITLDTSRLKNWWIWKYSQCKSYLISHSATGHFKEKNDDKYLILDSTDKYEEVCSGIRSEIKTVIGGKELFNEKTTLELELILQMICL